MTTAIVAGIFGLLPLVLGYLSSRNRQLSLLKREVEVLAALEEGSVAHRKLTEMVTIHTYRYVQREKSVSRRPVSAKVVNFILFAGVFMGYAIFFPATFYLSLDRPSGVLTLSNGILFLGATSLVLIFVGSLASVRVPGSFVRGQFERLRNVLERRARRRNAFRDAHREASYPPLEAESSSDQPAGKSSQASPPPAQQP